MREMRRKDRQLTEEEALAILKKGEYGVLSTVGSDGLPYGVPISYAFADNKIWFHGAGEGRKFDNMGSNNNVSFCVVGKTEVMPEKYGTKYESVIAAGKVRLCEGDEKTTGLMNMVSKYSSEFMEGGEKYANASINKVSVFCIEDLQITGKARRK